MSTFSVPYDASLERALKSAETIYNFKLKKQDKKLVFTFHKKRNMAFVKGLINHVNDFVDAIELFDEPRNTLTQPLLFAAYIDPHENIVKALNEKMPKFIMGKAIMVTNKIVEQIRVERDEETPLKFDLRSQENVKNTEFITMVVSPKRILNCGFFARGDNGIEYMRLRDDYDTTEIFETDENVTANMELWGHKHGDAYDYIYLRAGESD